MSNNLMFFEEDEACPDCQSRCDETWTSYKEQVVTVQTAWRRFFKTVLMLIVFKTEKALKAVKEARSKVSMAKFALCVCMSLDDIAINKRIKCSNILTRQRLILKSY